MEEYTGIWYNIKTLSTIGEFMGYIYKITNTVNNKHYIGKTEKSDPYKRWKEHLYASKQPRNKNRLLYRAINKYGSKNFTFEVLFYAFDASVMEVYFIEHYNSCREGYNATFGGDGKAYKDKKDVVALYNIHKSITKVALLTGLCTETVSDELKNKGVKVLTCSEINVLNAKQILLIDLNMVFSSSKEAANYIKDNGLSCSSIKSIRGTVQKCCTGKLKKGYGFTWSYV